MIGKLLERLRHANVMATIAVFLALGGGALAASKLNGSRIKNRTIVGQKLKVDTLTGTEIDESKLGKVPLAELADRATRASGADNADQLGGLGPAAFARGDVTVTGNRAYALNGTGATDVLGVPDLFKVIGVCGGGQSTLRLQNTMSPALAVNNVTSLMDEGSGSAAWKQLAPGDFQESGPFSGTLAAKTVIWQLDIVNGDRAGTVVATNMRYADGSCLFVASAATFPVKR
jgi:hypothetical protein